MLAPHSSLRRCFHIDSIVRSTGMYLFYSMAFTAAFLAMLPYFLYKAIRQGKYAASLSDRLGFISASLEGTGPVIWVHAVSVGEFLAAEPLVRKMIPELPGFRIVVSTTTTAGQTLARDRLGKIAGEGYRKGAGCPVFYFPFDWKFSVRRALDRIRPAAVIIMETEIWPNFLHECGRRGIVTIIANGRLSERSYSRYRLVNPFIRHVFKSITLLLMQTSADSDRALSLGANPDHVTVCGNLKYDAVELPNLPPDLGAAPGEHWPPNFEDSGGSEELHRIFGVELSGRLIIAGSTAAGEEDILLAAFERVTRTPGLEDTRLLLAPRRPERFDEVAEAISSSPVALQGGWVRRSRTVASAGDYPDGDLNNARIILLDSIGELASIYRFASVVFVGGSLVPHGGHNIIEPAAFAKPILVGPHTANFTHVVKDFDDAGALVRIASSDPETQVQELSAQMIRLLSDRAAARSMGCRGREILECNRGVTGRIVTAIKQAIAQQN